MSFIKKCIAIVSLAIFASAAMAAETINIVWGFNIGSNQANTVRAIIEELNKTQDRYTFVLVHKPGAGGTIAANHVTDNPNNTVVSMSSSFIIRPYFEKTEPTHNLDNFRVLLVQAVGSPMVFVSSKYSSLEQVLKSKDVSVGVSGIGSVSHLATAALASQNRQINIVNFKNMLDAATAAAGGHVDVAVGFLPDMQGLLDAGKLRVLGYTGQYDIPGYPGLQLRQHGLKDVGSLTANYAIFASKDMDPKRLEDLHNLFIRVNNAVAVRQSYAKDLLNVVNLNLTQSSEWYTTERAYWQRQVKQINGDKK